MIATLITSAAIVLVAMGLFAPFETLGWWAGWYGEKPGEDKLPGEANIPGSEAKVFVVYLTGIGGTSPTEYSRFEHGLLDGLAAHIPDGEMVDDVFPYAASNRALTGQRVFSWFWRRLKGLRGRGRLSTIAFLINIRNLWQVLVSSDARFGPLYNYAMAQHVLGKLIEHGYPRRSGIPIALIGYSGGGQIAVGAAPLLKEATRAPVHVVSLGGVMSSSENIMDLDSLTHLYGANDVTQRLGYIIFPQRWPFLPWTSWNRARRDGIITRVLVGPMVHTGPKSYLDPVTQMENGQSYLARTLEAITAAVNLQTKREDAPEDTRKTN